MSAADEQACARLIVAWGFYRDQLRWDDLLATFTPDGRIAVSWFSGAFKDFVERCKDNTKGGGSRSKHLLWPSLVRVAGERAIAETNVAIRVRQTIAALPVDLTSHARFLDRLERHKGRWLLVERAAIYEQDRLDPVGPSSQFDEMMRNADFSPYPEPYRYMGYRVTAAGRKLTPVVHYDGLAETELLKSRFNAWQNQG